jgi:thiamine-phosphate pyrophosphorylase
MFPSPVYLITDPLLCIQTDPSRSHSLFDVVEQALQGGISFVQYRAKDESRRGKYETAVKLREVLDRYKATFIVNDDIDLALAAKADGVHLGQEDFPLWVARKVLGKEAIVGISTHSLSEAIRAEAEGADYIGLGPIFPTETKRKSIPPLGIGAISEVKSMIRIPLYAIGGIRLEHRSDLLAAGADGVAVVSGMAGDIRSNARRWVTAFKESKP